MSSSFTVSTTQAVPANPRSEIIVAGLPRSGTTLMYRVLANRAPAGFSGPPAPGLIKVHYPKEEVLARGRVGLFMFGDVVNSVISTKNYRFEPNHFKNCGSDADPESVDIFDVDALNYERMFDLWHCRQDFPLLCVRYEMLYQYIGIVEQFLNRKIDLPPEVPRRTSYSSVSPQDLSRIQRTYSELIRKVAEAPDLAIYNIKNRK